jgi:dTDP-3-amino-3,4,6-trideoxy-alpha-D-glucose transaminase
MKALAVPRACYEVFDLECIPDPSGTLYVGELAQRGGGPFERFYFITGVPAGGRRGGHAHREQHEHLICLRGSVTVLVEAGGRSDAIALATEGRTLYLPPGYWRDLVDFSADALLAVLASHPFDEDDYIRDIDEFHGWETARG